MTYKEQFSVTALNTLRAGLRYICT